MTSLPKPPVGDSPFVTWCKQLMQCVRERTVIAGDNVTVDYTINGTVIKGNPRGAAGKTAPPASDCRWS